MNIHRHRSFLLAPILVLASWLVASPALAEDAKARPEVVQIKLSWSNAFLLKSPKPVLIDGGSPDDMPALTEALAKQGLRPQDIALVVLTHSHSDHAGMAAELQRAGVKIALGEGDVAMASAGHNDDLQPTNAMGYLLKRFAINPNFGSFTPDVVVRDSLDLAPWGITGQVVPMPGHTPGAMAIILDDGRAFVGDMILGGYLGGAVFSGHAGEHYFQADSKANGENIRTLLNRSIRTLYLGHGGPVTRESVLQAFGMVDATAIAVPGGDATVRETTRQRQAALSLAPSNCGTAADSRDTERCPSRQLGVDRGRDGCYQPPLLLR